MEEKELLIEQEGNVRVVTLNRPEAMNALSFGMVKGLAAAFRDAGEDDSVRAMILTANGRGFCTGADLTGPGGRQDISTPVGMKLTTGLYGEMVNALANLEKPVVGAINGTAAGAGCNLALACDLVIASQAAKFIQIFVRRGLVADAGGTYFVPRLVGLARAKELMFLGEEISAERALELGLVMAVAEPESLMAEARDLACRLAAGPTRAIGMIKKMLNHSFNSDLGACLELEAAFQGVAVSTADVVEGITSFLQKRPPAWQGDKRTPMPPEIAIGENLGSGPF